MFKVKNYDMRMITSNVQPREPVKIRAIIQRFFLLFLPFVIFFGIILTFFYQREKRLDLSNMTANGLHHVDMVRADLVHKFEHTIIDLNLLRGSNKLINYLENNSVSRQRDLGLEWLSFLSNNNIYDKISLLNEYGQELIQVEYRNGQLYIVPQIELQNKSEQFYFNNLTELEPDEIFLSPFDIYKDQAEDKFPIMSFIRFGLSIYDQTGKRKRYIILNYLANEILHSVESLSSPVAGHTMFLNANGYWFKQQKSDDKWTFRYFDKLDPDLNNVSSEDVELILNKQSGHYFTDKGGLFVFNTIQIDSLKHLFENRLTFQSISAKTLVGKKDDAWKIVLFIEPKILKSRMSNYFHDLLNLYIIMVFSISPVFLLLAWSRERRKMIEEELKEHRDRLEEKVKERTKELRSTNIQLVDALENAKRADQVKTLFLANMSHEIRTPLNAIMGFTDIIEQSVTKWIGADEKSYFETIKRSGERLMHTIHEILDISQIEAGTYNLVPQPIGMATIIKQLISDFEPQSQKKGLDISFRSNVEDDIIIADQYSVTQALTNLIDNAIKFTEKGYIKIQLRDEGENLILTIRDTGVGISPVNQKRIYKLFSQESEGYTKQFQGIGLGLSLAARYLELNNAKIDLKSDKGKGSTFTLKFKRYREPITNSNNIKPEYNKQ